MNRLDLADGHLAYSSRGSGRPPVLLLHGGHLDHRMWDREVEGLGRRTLAVAPDARTHGRSATARAPFRHCDDVAALVRHLDAGPAVLVGVSMGAGAAVDTALEHPDLVRALVLSGAGTNEPEFSEPWALALLARAEDAIRRTDAAAWVETMLELGVGPGRTLEDVDPTVVQRLRKMLEDFVATHVGPGLVPPDHVAGSWQRLPEIQVPVLGVVGALDSIDHQRMCERAVRSVADGRGVVRVDGAAHYPNLEQPAAWDAAVEAFLDDVGVPVPQS
ncbi:alpha/beta fold hydrolase [Georgenia alba]|uniref:Alpha/beta fold hydrolase n=1 Tax=Georgenia alba TaxID=2233858 RepID=A0ABW2Q762_9MICO